MPRGFKAGRLPTTNFPPRYNIAPTDLAIVVDLDQRAVAVGTVGTATYPLNNNSAATPMGHNPNRRSHARNICRRPMDPNRRSHRAGPIPSRLRQHNHHPRGDGGSGGSSTPRMAWLCLWQSARSAILRVSSLAPPVSAFLPLLPLLIQAPPCSPFDGSRRSNG
jgi:hypothetical protein